MIKSKPLKIIFSFIAFILCQNFQASAQTLAFPGAVGFGKEVTGGRNGTVYRVTNLNDSGAGSFRDAVSASNRIIVFDVSGYITLKTAVSAKSNLTIAGQTAPGEGIGFRGGKISFGKQSNIIIRHIRIRPGNEVASNKDVGINLVDARDVIVDHCTIEFAPWNNIGGVSTDWQKYPVTNITFQNCLIANPTYQQFGAHIECPNADWTWAYNIFANSHNRNPLDKVNDIFINNVLYNVSGGYTTHTSTKFKHDIINNYFVMGPASTGTDNQWYQVDKNQTIYYAGNLKDKNYDGILNGSATTPYWYQGTGTVLSAPWSAETSKIPTYSAATAFRYTSSVAGTFPHDEMDRLVMSQVRTIGKGTTGHGVGTTGPNGSLYTSQTQTGLSNNGYGTIVSGTKPLDTDNDGIPDFWEKTFGLNQNANDAMVKGSDGYTNIEKYINWLADVHAIVLQNKTLNFDMSVYTGGFAKVAPSYMLSNAVNGIATLLPDGKTVQFVPKSDFSGMASFQFTVTGSDGTAYKFTANIVVEKDNSVPVKDCNGVTNGTATLDECEICVGGNTGKIACKKDCNGTINGSAKLDDCGICSGGNTGQIACSGSLQGEDFCSAIGILEAKNPGFHGDGYLNLDNAIGTSATWYIYSDLAHTTQIGIRYANGGTVARGMNIFVNGSKQATSIGNSTGDFSTWKIENISLTFVKGINKLEVTSSTSDGAPNIDEFIFITNSIKSTGCNADCNGEIGGQAYIDGCNECVGGNTNKKACIKDCNGDINGSAYLDDCEVCVGGKSMYKACTVSMEAELACSVDGILLEDKNDGYSGEGYVNADNAIGAGISWKIYSDQNQKSTISFRYSNGGINSRDGAITINEVSAGQLLMPTTGDWTSWEVASVNLDLKQGINDLVITSTNSDGLANIDLLSFSAGVSPAPCLVTGSKGQTIRTKTYIYPNPTNHWANWIGDKKWVLINSMGYKLEAGIGNAVDLSTYPVGLYLLRLDNETIEVIKK